MFRVDPNDTARGLSRRPWLLTLGGMIAIGVVNLFIGFVWWPDPKPENEPLPSFFPDLPDAGPTADPAAPPPPAANDAPAAPALGPGAAAGQADAPAPGVEPIDAPASPGAP